MNAFILSLLLLSNGLFVQRIGPGSACASLSPQRVVVAVVVDVFASGATPEDHVVHEDVTRVRPLPLARV